MSEFDRPPRSVPLVPGAAEEISCENCTGACCQWSGGSLFITADDWYQNRQSMGLISGHPDVTGPSTSDRELAGQQKIPDGAGGWRMVDTTTTLPAGRMIAEFKGTECRNLEPPLPDSGLRPCRIYEDRPQVCRNLLVGSVACRNARKAAGLDGGTQITKADTYKEMGLTRSERRTRRKG